MRTVINNIRNGNQPEEFIVDMSVDDKNKSFYIEVLLPGPFGIGDKDATFFDFFVYTMVPKKIAAIILGMYAGKTFKFPIDLGDV